MKNACVFTLFVALAPVLHADSRTFLRASFPDGVALEIFTASTGAAHIDSEGEMGIGPGPGSQDLVNRVVVDANNNILFVYNIEASRGPSRGTVKIRILPISSATEAGMLKDYAKPGRPRFSGAHLPTVAQVTEFPAVSIGEAVTLDILSNPATGEKIYDVLRPVTDSFNIMSVHPAPAQETISLKQITVRVNGRVIPAPVRWLIGTAVRIDIPSHGGYVVIANNPEPLLPARLFNVPAHADGKTLSFTADGDRVEITSGTNILTRSVKGTLWVYHDKTDSLRMQASDNIESLLFAKHD